MNLKPAKELKLDNVSGTITVKESAPQLECPTSTELEVLQALTRRSLAFDCAGLIDFHIAQKWVPGPFLCDATTSGTRLCEDFLDTTFAH